jgi:hypothetical protein
MRIVAAYNLGKFVGELQFLATQACLYHAPFILAKAHPGEGERHTTSPRARRS